MTFLPIVARELRVAARKRSTYWMRTGAAAAVLVLGTWFFLMLRHQPAREVALVLFGILTGSAVLYCLLSGVRSTADCLSEEKREGTLGLLFLTDLNGYDVVIGKLAATSLSSLYAVIAVLPMLAIPLLMGGVSPGEFGRMALVAVNTLFFSLTLGICVSTMSRSARKAVGLTFALLLVFTVLPPLFGSWQVMSGRSRNPETLLMLPSAGFNYYRAWDNSYRAGPGEFWLSLGIIHGLGWVFLAVASVVAPRSWQDKPAGRERLRWRERWLLWSYGNLAERQSYRKRLLDQSAFFWLAARARLKPAYLWAVFGLLGCGWFWGWVKFREEWLNEGIYITTGWILVVMIKSWFGSEASRQLAEERQHGTLELLLSTPLTVRDILHGQLLALFRQFFGPVMVTLLACFIFMLAPNLRSMAADERTTWVLFWLATMAMLIADLCAFFWVGLWQGLVARNPQRAASATVSRVLGLPWITIAGIWLFFSILSIGYGPGFGLNSFLLVWFIVGVGFDFHFAARARYKLLTEFRAAATRKFEPPPGMWTRLFGRANPQQPQGQ